MVVSGTPAALAVMAAPIRKLCPLKLELVKPETANEDWTWCTKTPRRRGLPSGKINRGPGASPLTAKKSRRADTGQMVRPVAPSTTWVPAPNLSVLDFLMLTTKKTGGSRLSEGYVCNRKVAIGVKWALIWQKEFGTPEESKKSRTASCPGHAVDVRGWMYEAGCTRLDVRGWMYEAGSRGWITRLDHEAGSRTSCDLICCIKEAVIGNRHLALEGDACSRCTPRSKSFMWGV